MSQTNDPAAIARGLSEAQKRLLVQRFIGDRRTPATRGRLFAKGLGRWRDFGYGRFADLTPLGVAVREEIQREKTNTPPAGGERNSATT